ncbi:hypothetical protein FQR65_LT06880 [Abscondita terminalis]|nr:hypothetical protein FQR65_LT06880 [Abscondita terminalis]
MKAFILLLVIFSAKSENIFSHIFPYDFEFGTATSAHQIEGAWNVDGKGPSMWDHFTHVYPEKIQNRANADVATNAYYKTKEDVQLLKNLGVDFYRFSISWPRILPTGFKNKINKAGIQYYNDLIDELLANNIKPIITMHHWEIPLTISNLGAFANEAIVDWFEDYARILFETFGDRVKCGLPLTNQGYSGIANYLCNHNVLKAHARVYHVYHKEFKHQQQGRIGIAPDCQWYEPGSNSTEDVEAALRSLQFNVGRILHPILSKNGDYPEIMKTLVNDRSNKEGFAKSRLPTFTQEEIQLLKGSTDFLAINHYTTYLAYHQNSEIGEPCSNKDNGAMYLQDSSWPSSNMNEFKSVPWGIRKILKWLKNSYGEIDIYITENGYAGVEELNDQARISYHKSYLSSILESIHLDKVPVKGYAVWSFLDAFEWIGGYTLSFGLYHVNFSDPNRPRTPKKSVEFYKQVIKEKFLRNQRNSNKFPDDFLFGTATSSHQIEGAWDVDGKGPSMWDHFTHAYPEKINNGSNADIATNAYYKTKEDVQLLKNLGVDFYRFSISWSRILPTGFKNNINKAGIKYYNDLIDELLANNIKPFVTMHHWELPLVLSNLGGFTNEAIVEWFEDYSRILFEHFGDRVKMWITINEPRILCDLGYGVGVIAPGINQSGIANYLCKHNVLRSHARAYHLYHEQFKNQEGRIGIAPDCQWYEPASNSIEDVEAAKRSFTDFLAVNHYTTYLVHHKYSEIGEPCLDKDTETICVQDPLWPSSVLTEFKTVPWGIRKILLWLKNSYDEIDIYITENGYPDTNELNDQARISYHESYLSNILDSIHLDKVSVKGYAVWSFLDSFEWYSGYSASFGLYHVNFSDPSRPRTPKKSVEFYRQVIKEYNLTNMKFTTILTFLIAIKETVSVTVDHRTFPTDFLFGTATSAAQIEGGWNVDGRSASLWDNFVHTSPENIENQSNADIACNSYYKIKEDVKLLKQLGVNFYRFSISWSRILPNGFANFVNPNGVKYYNELINELIENGITPMITIYHWDLPQVLSELGGFTNRDLISWFRDYANILFETFGDRVKHWLTFNEPRIMCDIGYGSKRHAPGINNPGLSNYLCGHNLLIAHAHAYKLYKNKFQHQKGQVGIVVDCQWFEPGSNNTDDVNAAQRQLQFDVGRFLHPILSKEGDYPDIVKTRVAQRSQQEGFSKSRLPQFSRDEIDLIQNSIDFLGVNHYTAYLTYDKEDDPIGEPSHTKDSRTLCLQDDSWPNGAVHYFKTVPWALRNVLNWIKNSYNSVDIYITENGYADLQTLEDEERINYHKSYLNSILNAMYEDGVPIKGYTIWSLWMSLSGIKDIVSDLVCIT